MVLTPCDRGNETHVERQGNQTQQHRRPPYPFPAFGFVNHSSPETTITATTTDILG